MKKLSKIKLHDAVEMTDNEMKKVVGGFSTGTEETSGDYTCEPGGSLECDGTCPDNKTCHHGESNSCYCE